MSREPATRTIFDDDGAEHSYIGIPHPAQEGMKLALKLLGLIGPSLAMVLVDAFKGSKNMEDVLNTDLDLKGAIGALCEKLALEATAQLLREMLRYVKRDGQDLKNDGIFGMAFQANYGELIEALKFAAEVNRFDRFFKRMAPMD